MRLAIDRFEGDLAVLVTDDGRSISWPRDLLPEGARAGEVLSLKMTRDRRGTADVARKARAVRDDLGKTDPGGDIEAMKRPQVAALAAVGLLVCLALLWWSGRDRRGVPVPARPRAWRRSSSSTSARATRP